MTLDSTIEFNENMAKMAKLGVGNKEAEKEYSQLANWLKELRTYRKLYPNLPEHSLREV